MCAAETPPNTTSPSALRRGLYSFFDKERYDVYIVDVRGTDWRVQLPGGEEAKIDRNDFSFVKTDSTAVVFDYAYITIHGQPGENGPCRATST